MKVSGVNMEKAKNSKYIKELRPIIENEVLHRYDNLEKAQDSANVLIGMIEKAFSQQRKEIIKIVEDCAYQYETYLTMMRTKKSYDKGLDMRQFKNEIIKKIYKDE